MKMILVTIILSVLVGGVLCAPNNHCIDRTTVDTFDLPRFMGRWYEIARYDHRFERRLEAVIADYTLLSDGTVDVLNRGIDERTGREREARGRARPTDQPGKLRVSFFWFFYADYNVLALAPDYSWALIGSRSPKYLWILARTPQLPATQLGAILRLAEEKGYATAPLIYVDQPTKRGQATEQSIPKATT